MDEFIAERRACQDTLWSTCHPLPGVRKLVEHLAKHKIPMAVATGSISRNYKLKAAHHPEIFDHFKNRAICGDDPRLKGCGKPRPDIFLLAAELLGRNVGEGDVSSLDTEGKEGRALIEERSRGLVLEDSINGLEAGQRAGMKSEWALRIAIVQHVDHFGRETAIWVPDERLRALAPGKTFGADCVLESLEQFRPEEWGLPPYDS
ncbi:hypothetical protein FRC00_011926 [Tulasnella sp. 408]|nr:hypothetical protein FRC00_011926 [Tulasnella sp. 408]